MVCKRHVWTLPCLLFLAQRDNYLASSFLCRAGATTPWHADAPSKERVLREFALFRWCVCAPWGCSAGARKTMRRERSIWLLREQQTRPCAHLAQKNQAQGPSPPSQDRYLGRSRWEKVPTGSLWPKTVKADFPSTLARVATFRKSQATFGGYFSHFFEKSRFLQKRDVSNVVFTLKPCHMRRVNLFRTTKHDIATETRHNLHKNARARVCFILKRDISEICMSCARADFCIRRSCTQTRPKKEGRL